MKTRDSCSFLIKFLDHDKLELNQDTNENVLQERQHKHSFLYPMKSLNLDNIWIIFAPADKHLFKVMSKNPDLIF